jgi:multidrug efflux pump subunit AcrA (membrane-fusion protein)
MKVKKLAFTLIAIIMLAGCTADIAAAPELLEPVGVKIDTTKAYIGTIYDIKVFEGTVLPKIEELYFVSDGLIGEVKAFIGSQVKKGDVLARLDVDSYKTQLDALKSSLDFDITNNELKEVQAQCDIEIAEVELRQLQENNAPETQIINKHIQIETLKNDLIPVQSCLICRLRAVMKKSQSLKKLLQTA